MNIIILLIPTFLIVVIFLASRKKPEVNTFESLTQSINELNRTVLSQGVMIEKLNGDISQRKKIIDSVRTRLFEVEEERDRLLDRVKTLERDFVLRRKQSEELLDRLCNVEAERDSLLKRIALLEYENQRLENSMTKTKF